ncbi:SURF1 family protein [Sphingomonas rhizophila]|uniref:SURF1-like protein n=1 Tax=Sphingomonas rhizophila TaxID=2071607 RepID=A0A7G9SB08_9SPHN|nr:SURF1 family protein [Sphingomonas rhizophila]QNN65033.1 SURF1 family protein [Sphingomonas rhizophila]
MIRRLPLLPTVLVAAAVATMIGLGIWQLQRAAWKEGLLATYRTAQGQPGIAFPTFPTKNEPPYFRKATGHCLDIVGWRSVAGQNLKGESGYARIADCRTGAEGPGMVVVAGWSKDPNAASSWKGGIVEGVIGPDQLNRLRLVSTTGLGGLEASAPPSLESIPNNHRAYAVQWFLFAAIALVIYVLALRKQWAKEPAQ